MSEKAMPAFELIWKHRKEIVAEWNETGSKKKAVEKGCELTGLKQTTVSQNIQALPFLCDFLKEIERENEELCSEVSFLRTKPDTTQAEQRIKTLESAHDDLVAEIDRKVRELDRGRTENAMLKEKLAESEGGETELKDLRNEMNELKEMVRGKVGGEVRENEAELKELRREISELKEMVRGKVGGEVRGSKSEVPGNWEGWTVSLKRKKAGAYYELVRKVGGKLRFLYVGKNWDGEKASLKIRQFELGEVRP